MALEIQARTLEEIWHENYCGDSVSVILTLSTNANVYFINSLGMLSLSARQNASPRERFI